MGSREATGPPAAVPVGLREVGLREVGRGHFGHRSVSLCHWKPVGSLISLFLLR